MLNIKRNFLFIFFWLLLLGYITQSISIKYGVPYLFLSPEYLGEVNVTAHIIMGFALGGFIMTFNIYTYITHGIRFNFLATLARPFYKFCINNFIIPLLFILLFIYKMVCFQHTKELLSTLQITLNIIGFLLGILAFILLSALYFFRTNKDIYKLSGKEESYYENQKLKQKIIKKESKMFYITKLRKDIWDVETYLSSPTKILLARDSEHYDKQLLSRVFFQNHINASFFSIAIIILFFILGIFRANPIFEIPAAASIILLFTIILMIISVLYSWLRGWMITLVIILLLLVNNMSKNFEWLNARNYVYGLDYKVEKAAYNDAEFDKLRLNDDNFKQDIKLSTQVLNKWKFNVTKLQKNTDYKPKLIIVTASGGGSRSALWTFKTMQYLDSVVGGKLMENTRLITGASGGMLGAAYFREIYLQSKQTEEINIYDKKYINNISKDLLNPILFSVATNDIFIRYQKTTVAGKEVIKDRAYDFEKALNKNTDNVLNKKILDYYLPVKDAEIPMMIFSPTVLDDCRRFLISEMPISYMSRSSPAQETLNSSSNENIEFNRFFEKQQADQLLLTSAIRVNSTFPYILPAATLPTKPEIDIMDAGSRDNYGIKTTVQYLYNFKEWIQRNTSGVIIIDIRDKQKNIVLGDNNKSLFNNMMEPMGVLYNNFTRIHDFTNDQFLQYGSDWFGSDFHVVSFELRQGKGERISLSWHLTQLEKKQIINSLELPENQSSTEKLKELLIEK
jgi:hypothetical protein